MQEENTLQALKLASNILKPCQTTQELPGFSEEDLFRVCCLVYGTIVMCDLGPGICPAQTPR